MPTVDRIDGFRVIILFPPREHGPAHVHVVNADGLAKIRMRRPGVSQKTVKVEGMRRADVRKAERIVRQNTEEYLVKWRDIHGDDD